MKAVLNLFVALTLLLQGAFAVAMPIQVMGPETEESAMPCHDTAAKTKEGTSCCKQMSDDACHAICSVAALPSHLPETVRPKDDALIVPRDVYAVRAAYRATLIRPPISHSA